MADAASILNIGSDALGLAEGVGQFISGIGKEKKDDAEIAALKRPFYKIQGEYTQNRDIAGNLAESGLPDSTKNFLTSQAGKGLTTSLSSILAGGGSPDDVSKLFSAYSTSIDNTAAQDAQAKIANIQYFMGANKDLGIQKNIQFGVNELQPYEEQLKNLNERKAADEQTKYGGVNTAIGSVSAASTSLSNADLYSRLFGDTNPYGSNVGNPIQIGNYDTVAKIPTQQQGQDVLQSKINM